MSSSVKILSASAGSGKTYRLAYEYIKVLIFEPRAYSTILAVTFTNKATEEMKSRILVQLNALVSGVSPYIADLQRDTGFDQEKIRCNALAARTNILHDYSRFAVSTIDKFFQKIIRGFVNELGLDVGYTVELHGDNDIGEAIDRVVERAKGEAGIAVLISRVIEDSIEDERSWDIRKEIAKIAGEILKERYQPLAREIETVIEKFDKLREDIDNKKERRSNDAAQTVAYIAANGLQPGDFKGGERSNLVKIFLTLAEGELVEKFERLEKAAESAEEWYSKTSFQKEKIKTILPKLMQATRNIIAPYREYEYCRNSFELLADNFNKRLLLSYISEELHQIWAERGKLPIHQTTKLIGDLVKNTAVSFIYEKAGNRFGRYMIDEFQDTSAGQWRNFLPLLDDAIAGSSEGEAVMLIGDVKQAIYRWRGGDWSILSGGASYYWKDEADVSEHLRRNYRSKDSIVCFNNELIRAVVNSACDRELTTIYEDFEQDVPEGKDGGYICIKEIENEDFIVNQVRDALARGYRQGDIAMLVRTKNQGREVADLLLRNGLNIIDQESLLLKNSPAVITIVSLFKLALNPKDSLALANYNRHNDRMLDAPFEQQDFLADLLAKNPVDALDEVIKMLNSDSEFSFVQAFYQVVVDFSRENSADLASLIEWWDERSDKLSLYLPSSQDAITIATIHKSKGLQYPIVFIPFCNWSTEPTSQPPTMLWCETEDKDFEEFNPSPLIYKKAMANSAYAYNYLVEKRNALIDAVNMLYVALTRAEDELYVFQKIPKKKSSSSIYNFIKEFCGEQSEFGSKATKICNKTLQPHDSITFDKFDITLSKQRVRTSWDSERFYEDGGVIETPVSQGILLHQLFSQINSREDIVPLVNAMVVSGDFSAERGEEIIQRISKSFENELIASWFDSSNRIFSENAIILPKSTSTKRPDRVIISNNAVTVVDFKFGMAKNSRHSRQIEEYKMLLAEMGYADVRGYLWYVEQELVFSI